MAVPNFTRAAQTVARNQTFVNEALIVCSLERYRRTYGEYPLTLELLSPRFLEKLPYDLISGKKPDVSADCKRSIPALIDRLE